MHLEEEVGLSRSIIRPDRVGAGSRYDRGSRLKSGGSGEILPCQDLDGPPYKTQHICVRYWSCMAPGSAVSRQIVKQSEEQPHQKRTAPEEGRCHYMIRFLLIVRKEQTSGMRLLAPT